MKEKNKRKKQQAASRKNYTGLVLTCIMTAIAREFDTLKCKKVPQSLEIGLFFCQIFIFII